MALTQFAFMALNQDSPVAFAGGATIEIKTPSGTSGATTAASTASQNVCRVATDTAVYVTFAASPTATSSNGFYVPANGVEYFRVGEGLKGAVITA